jgi:carbonic anhydrase
MRHSAPPLAVVLTLATLSCQSTSPPSTGWSYQGDTGPAHWGDLEPEFVLAKTGKHQSPIDVVPDEAVAAQLPELETHYHATTVNIINNGHTIEDDYTGGGYMEVDGHRYDLAQFHFHSPSEHTIDGKHSAMEMHLVHKDAQDQLAVLAVMINEGAENSEFRRFGHCLPAEPGRADVEEDLLVDATKLLPPSLASYRYSGSLTTPPCTEGVNWIILQTPIQASQQQIKRFRTLYYGNNRPTQPLHARIVQATR